jgi:hypothetical protein
MTTDSDVPIFATTNLWTAAFMLANGLRFLHAVATGGRSDGRGARFVFADPRQEGRTLEREFLSSQRMQRFVSGRNALLEIMKTTERHGTCSAVDAPWPLSITTRG